MRPVPRLAILALAALLAFPAMPGQAAQAPAPAPGQTAPIAVVEALFPGAVEAHTVADPLPEQVRVTRPTPGPSEPRPDQGTQPSAAKASQDDPAGAFAIRDPVQARFMARLAAARDAEGVMGAFVERMRALGYPMPPSRPEQFDENSTVAYSYSVGDLDNDGAGDLMLDEYCTQSPTMGCPPLAQVIDLPTGGRFTPQAYCSTPHLLRAVSGATGQEIWTAPLDTPHLVPGLSAGSQGGCALEFMVGLVPLEDGVQGMLVYRYEVLHTSYDERFRVHHRFWLLDPRHAGETSWAFEENGTFETFPLNFYGNAASVARNIVIDPILMRPPQQGVPVVARDHPTALFLQGVGWTAEALNSLQNPPTSSGAIWLVKEYQPDEWAARLDPVTGAQGWRVPTFQPDPRHQTNVEPHALRSPSLAGTHPLNDPQYAAQAVRREHQSYWGGEPCCFDATGDGVSDLLFWTAETAAVPVANLEGPDGQTSHLVAFSGADGKLAYTHLLHEDAQDPHPVQTYTQALGDVDDDGADDFAIHDVFLNFTYHHVVAVHSGRDGRELWRLDDPRDNIELVLGDVDGDGGNDFLLVEWKDYEEPFGQILGDYNNVTHLALKVFSGRDGDIVWRGESFVAAADVVNYLNNIRLNGLPDFDHDGVADVPADDPILLPDRTVVHRISILSPARDRVLWTLVSAGAFAVPTLAGDLDGDGTDDLALMNGDPNDLWLTAHSGTDGHAMWSRRLLNIRISSYTSALPSIHNHPISSPQHPGHDLVMNFQVDYQTGGSFVFAQYLASSLASNRGTNGSVQWSHPIIYNPALSANRAGASPASALFAAALAREQAPLSARAAQAALRFVPPVAVFGAVFAGSFLLMRRRREDL